MTLASGAARLLPTWREFDRGLGSVEMERSRLKSLLVEGWAFVAVAVIAFAGGFLIGDLGASPKTETVLAPASEKNEAGAAEGAGEAAEAGGEGGAAADETAPSEEGAQVFVSNGCGSCHTFAAANSTGTTGPDLNEYLAPDDDKAGIEEMIVEPNSEIAEGFQANVMPPTYGQSLSEQELEQLVQFLIKNSPAGGTKPEGPGGEENDVGGPEN
jgi:cytochrome c5